VRGAVVPHPVCMLTPRVIEIRRAGQTSVEGHPPLPTRTRVEWFHRMRVDREQREFVTAALTAAHSDEHGPRAV
jgi:hypothetical protein